MHSKPKDIEFGNASATDTQGTGWFIGFSDWCKSGSADLRHVHGDVLSAGPHVKWFNHPAGHPNGEVKPVSEGRSICILVGPPSEFRIEFSCADTFESKETSVHVLRDTGDFVIWGKGIFHRSFGIQPATILTLRWVSQLPD
ncbi:MAG: hypothetical protein HYX47_01940 [Burkholderiales bacterium]|nr:hypothetical protein [Burkholderiales bacterium]